MNDLRVTVNERAHAGHAFKTRRGHEALGTLLMPRISLENGVACRPCRVRASARVEKFDTVISTHARTGDVRCRPSARLTSVPRAVCLCVCADNRHHAVLHGPA